LPYLWVKKFFFDWTKNAMQWRGAEGAYAQGALPWNNWTATGRLWLESRIDVCFFRH